LVPPPAPPAASVPPPQIPILIDVSSDDEDALVAACEESEAKVKALVEAEKERAEAEAKKKAAAAEESAQLENLTCPVCQGIFYEPICITECMHSFCGSCLSAWHFDEKKTTCPQCRLEFDASTAKPNHLLNNIIDTFLKANPEQDPRSEEEKEELKKKNRFRPGAFPATTATLGRRLPSVSWASDPYSVVRGLRSDFLGIADRHHSLNVPHQILQGNIMSRIAPRVAQPRVVIPGSDLCRWCRNYPGTSTLPTTWERRLRDVRCQDVSVSVASDGVLLSSLRASELRHLRCTCRQLLL
jgi:hypothetical protein